MVTQTVKAGLGHPQSFLHDILELLPTIGGSVFFLSANGNVEGNVIIGKYIAVDCKWLNDLGTYLG